MKITQEVRAYAQREAGAKPVIEIRQALDGKAEEFRARGSELYL